MAAEPNADRPFLAPAFGSAMFEGFCRRFFASYCSLVVEGRDFLPAGPFLLCSNHASHIDSAALMTASGRSFGSFALLGASDYFFRSSSLRWSVSPLMNVIPIDRHPGARSLASCLESCHLFLKQTGGTLILYPEGTRSSDGEMQPFKTGAAWFATELGVPLVPAYIEGSHRILPKGSSVPRPGPVTVRFGRLLATAAGMANSVRERRREMVEQLARDIRLLGLGGRTQDLLVPVQQKG